MGKVAADIGASFVLSLGDNFYEAGVNTLNKGRFQTTFENVYTEPSLNIDWHVIAGNRDHLGSVLEQIDYSQKSTRWNFPAPYYLLNFTLPSGKVAEFVMFDSVVAAGMSYKNPETLEPGFVPLADPKNKEVASAQWTWIQKSLAQSKADYLFTVAHYPVWSACEHGPTSELVQHLRPLLNQYRVTAHVSGHDHCLSHIQDGNVRHVLSGAGARAWSHLINMHRLGQGVQLKWQMTRGNAGNYKGGFAAMALTDQSAVVRYYGDDGTLLYTSEPMMPRDRLAATS